jgi:hypothetical protein
MSSAGTSVAAGRGLAGAAASVRALALRHPTLAALVFLALLTLASRPATIRMAIPEDAGSYLYVGQTILDGGTPYVDAADNKGPVTYLLFALIRLGSGTSAVAVRLTLLCFAVLAALALAAYVARFAGRVTGLVAGAAFAALGSADALEGAHPNTEQYGIAPIVGSLWLATRATARRSAAAGAAIAAAGLVNPAFLVAAPFALFELWRAGGPATRRARFAAAGGGALAVTVPVLAWITASGALDDMGTQVFGYAREAASSPPPTATPDGVRPGGLDVGYLLDVPAPGLFAVGLAGGALAAADRRLRPIALPSIVWILVMWARVKVPSYEYSHHYYLAMPGIAAGLALGLTSLWQRRDPWWTAAAVLAVAVPLAVYVVRPQVQALEVPPWERWGHGNAYAVAYRVAEFIDDHTEPGEPVFMAGGAGEVYWLADRSAPTRFFTEYHLHLDPAYPGELDRALRRRPPIAVGVLPGDRVARPIQYFMTEFRYHRRYRRDRAAVWLIDPRQ